MLQGKVSDISRDFLRRLILAGGLGGGAGAMKAPRNSKDVVL